LVSTTIDHIIDSLDAIAIAARAIKAGEANLVIAGGVESMSRAPYLQAVLTYGRHYGYLHRLG
jgi:acetyl-CoA acetyltransferase